MTSRSIPDLIRKHGDFWERKPADAPLIGFTIGAGTDSWSYWRDNKATAGLWNKERIQPDDLDPAAFVEDQLRYLELSDQVGDDVIRTAMPFASMPWLEAIAGCPIVSSGQHLASKPFLEGPAQADSIVFDPGNPWVQKYVEFLDVYAQAFDGKHPVGQSVLRGPSDLAGALLGTEPALEALLLEPEAMEAMLGRIAALIEQFIRYQLPHIPSFCGGHVIGQYELWAPGTVQRMQEDGASLYSPALYRKFLKPIDMRLAAAADYTLIHLHAPALRLIDDMLEIPGIRLFQITKDEGATRLDAMMPGLEKIQSAGRCLIVKGRFADDDVKTLREGLRPTGLCVQPVVNSIGDALSMLPGLRRWQ